MVCSQVKRGFGGVRAFIETPVLEPRGEGPDLGPRGSHRRRNASRIDTSAEKHAERDVRHQLRRNRSYDCLSRSPDDIFFALGRKVVELPEVVRLRLEDAAGFRYQHMPRQKFFHLPEHHTDFIFAIVGEELGFIGAAILIILLFILSFIILQFKN